MVLIDTTVTVRLSRDDIIILADALVKAIRWSAKNHWIETFPGDNQSEFVEYVKVNMKESWDMLELLTGTINEHWYLNLLQNELKDMYTHSKGNAMEAKP